MTDDELAALRDAAMAVRDLWPATNRELWGEFEVAASPDVILALVDEVRRLRAALKAEEDAREDQHFADAAAMGKLLEEVRRLRDERDELLKAARAVIDAWDTDGPTSTMEDLRDVTIKVEGAPANLPA